jgi:hypothetical protein
LEIEIDETGSRAAAEGHLPYITKTAKSKTLVS